MAILNGYSLKISKEVHLVTTRTTDDKSKEPKKKERKKTGNDLLLSTYGNVIVVRNTLFQMRKSYYNENLLQSLWEEG